MTTYRRTALLALVTLLPVVSLGAEQPATPQPLPILSFSKANIAIVVAAFKTGTPATMDARLPTINAWLAADHVPAELWKNCLPPMIAQHRDAEVADIALRGILGRPEGRAYHYLLPIRIEALLALDQTGDALQAAKSYYNVADNHHLPHALQLLNTTLHKAHPDDPTLFAKFMAQHNAATPPSEPILKSITIDPSPYTAAIAHWKARADAGKLADKIAYGNLLLIVDRPAEAEPLFRELLKVASSKADVAIVNDCVAASLRAQDQNATRANAFLAQQQAAAPAVDLPAVKDKDLP